MDFYFDELDKLFRVAGFGLPTKIKFNTPDTKDMMPACWKVWEEKVHDPDTDDCTYNKKMGYKAVCRTVGISPDDVKVTQEDYGICVQGKTEVDGKEYSQYMELPISEDIMANITGIDYKTENGLTYIYLKVQSPDKKKIEIRKLDK